MSEAQHTLDTLQRWMQAVITHPGGVAAGIDADAARANIPLLPAQAERVIRRSRSLTALERLEIYHQAYFGRLLECLREEYSVLAAALGGELFDAFAVAYLESHPSRSYTLSRLGADFPEFLAVTRPEEAQADASCPCWPEFLIDLARLERVVNEVFDGPGMEGRPPLVASSLHGVAPGRWPEARLVCAPCLRLVKLTYPVNDYFSAMRRGEKPVIPQPAASHVAVTRRDYRVVRFPLQPAQYELLTALIEHEPIGRAVARAAAVSPDSDAQLAADLRNWFRAWATEGFFCEVVE